VSAFTYGRLQRERAPCSILLTPGASDFAHLAGWLYLAKNNRRIAINRIIVLGFHFKSSVYQI
jgi:hypothetical protein